MGWIGELLICSHDRVILVLISRVAKRMNSSSRKYIHYFIFYTTWWVHKWQPKRRFNHIDTVPHLVSFRPGDDDTIDCATHNVNRQLWHEQILQFYMYARNRSENLVHPTIAASPTTESTVGIKNVEATTHCPLLCRCGFQTHVLEKKMFCCFSFTFTDVSSWWSRWQQVAIGAGIAWRRTGDKLIPETIMCQVIEEYILQQTS